MTGEDRYQETVVRELQFIMRDILCYSRANNIIIWLSEHKAWIPPDIITLLGSQAKLPCDSPLLLPARSPLILVVQSRQLRVSLVLLPLHQPVHHIFIAIIMLRQLLN